MNKKLSLILFGVLLVSFSIEAFADQQVRGYVRRDGTYVAPHMRSSPDRSYNNNWSTSPNVNPYTGQQGTRSPTFNDRAPSSNPYGANPYGTNPYGQRRY